MSKDQPITGLLHALKNMEADILERIEVNIYGSVHARHLAAIAVADMSVVVKVQSYRPHRELIARIVNADLLLCLSFRKRQTIRES
jgi:hypothetical protein